MAKNILLFVMLFLLTTSCYAQGKTTKKSKTNYSANPVKPITKDGYKKTIEKRQIKYLYEDEFNILVFFDNGKAAMTHDFVLCQDNLFKLYTIPTPYDYEIIQFGETIISYSKKEDKNATGLKLSRKEWIIKDFEQVKELKKCRPNEIQTSERSN